MIDKESLIVSLHDLGAVKFGEFTRPRGDVSPIFIDTSLLIARPGTLRRIARLMENLSIGLTYDRLGALPMGGIPIALALSLTIDRPLIYPRPGALNSSGQRLIEGQYQPGETLLLIDDVLSTGHTKLKTIRRLESLRLHVPEMMVLVDRGLGGATMLTESGCRVQSVLTLVDILDTLLRLRRISKEQHRFVHAWIEEHQVPHRKEKALEKPGAKRG